MYDADGNIDLKAGDETVESGWADVQNWDPTPVLKALYDDPRPEQDSAEDSGDAARAGNVRMEGFLEKLPKGAKKATLLQRWQRRYFKARDGELFYYEDIHSKRATGFIRLRGSEVRFKGGLLLEIFDAKKKMNMMLKASSTAELEDWKMGKQPLG